MSQRSHIAQSGSIAISACSAACSVERSFGIASSSSSCAGSGQNQIASVAKVDGGQSSGTSSIRSCEADRLALVADDLLGHLDLAEHEVEPEHAAPRAAARASSVSVSRFGCVYQSPRNGSTTARSVVSSSSRTRYDSPPCR